MSQKRMVERAAKAHPEKSLELRFMAVNRDRLRRVYDTLHTRQQSFVELVPLLFHVNHPLLPGYVSHDTPAGISDYTPGRSASAAARQLVRTFVYEHRLQRSYAIRGLYLMGSPGTIAYTRHSDLDVWLVHDPELPEEDLAKLREKARRIEDYSQGTGLEMHFFVLDAERYKAGQTLSLSAESSGSSQHYLLLDEFYRSGLLLAGLRPLWWAVPPEEEHRYDDYVADALRKRLLSARSYVDFGGLARIPAEEFFGATVWQLYKSIESPYKSMMKLLLMEAYASEYPAIGLLSHRHKLEVLRDGVTLDELDPYLAMYRKVEEYLMSNADEARLKLLRRAFYIKANESLSMPPDSRQPPWRRDTMTALTRQWGWNRHHVQHLDRRQRWRIDTAIVERRELVKVLQKSYSALSEFAKEFATDKRITELDLTILGRKLYAAFDKKPNKIDLITRGLCAAPEEAALSLYQMQFERSGQQWVVFDGAVTPDEISRKTPLRRSGSLVDILAWCFFNRLTGHATEWHHYANGRRESSLAIRKILEALESTYPQRELAPSELNALSKAPRVLCALFFANVGTETAHLGLQVGDVLTSDRTDAFQFGGNRVNLIHSIDLLVQTSWEELYCFRYEGHEGIAQALCEYLNRLGATREDRKDRAIVHCFDGDYGYAIVQRLTRYLAELSQLFEHVAAGTAVHHVISIGESYCDLYRSGNSIRYHIHPGSAALCKSLGMPTTEHLQVEFGSPVAQELPLAAIYAANRRGSIQIFALPVRERIETYILDARGALFRYVHNDADPLPLFDHLTRFLANIERRANIERGTPPDRGVDIECHLIRRISSGYQAQAMPVASTDSRPYLPLRLFTDIDRNKKPLFTAYLDDQQFSSVEHGQGLFAAIAAAVLSNREGRERYPVYITDLELSPAVLQARGIDARNGVELLRQKLRIERKLTQALGRELAPAEDS